MERYKIGFKLKQEVEEKFPSNDVIQYLQLKVEGKRRSEIIEIMGFGADYIEQRFRRYILKKMNCNSINKAIISAYKNGWICIEKK